MTGCNLREPAQEVWFCICMPLRNKGCRLEKQTGAAMLVCWVQPCNKVECKGGLQTELVKHAVSNLLSGLLYSFRIYRTVAAHSHASQSSLKTTAAPGGAQ